jgi:hypothetical protein
MPSEKLLKRKMSGEFHFMPDGEYSLCGEAFDGETGDDWRRGDEPLQSVREISCAFCLARINAVKQLLKMKAK